MTRMRSAARARKPVVAIAEEPWACRCKPKPHVIAHFRNEQLISVTRVHNRSNPDGSAQDCHLAPERLDVKEWRDGR